MTTTETLAKLRASFTELNQVLESFSEAQFFQRPEPNKWSAAENAAHLFLSIKPLVSLFGKKELMAQWGKSEKPSGTYDEVVALYLKHIGNGGQSTPTYVPQAVEATKALQLQNLESVNAKFLERAVLLSEADLDTYRVPHPLIGLLSCREFLFFTDYHTLHHLGTIKGFSGLTKA